MQYNTKEISLSDALINISLNKYMPLLWIIFSYGMWEKDTYIFNKSKLINYSFVAVLKYTRMTAGFGDKTC